MNKPLIVKSKYINNYLNYVWGKLKEKYGSFGTQQSTYDHSVNRELYYFSSSFSFHQNGKVVSLLLHISKDKGIYQISQNSDDNQDPTFAKEIINIFIESPKGDDLNKYIKSKEIKVKVNTGIILSGNYTFHKSGFKIEDHSVNGYFYLIFNVDYIQKEEITKKAIKKSDEILSTLSLLIYDYFSLYFNEQIAEDIDNSSCISGSYIENENYIDSDEIIQDGKYFLPPDSDEIIFTVLNSPTRLKSARLFREALCFRREFINSRPKLNLICVDSLDDFDKISSNHSSPQVCHNDLNDVVKKYEIIAYVSAIESILPTESIKEVTECPKCKTQITNNISGIAKKFNEFVERNASESPRIQCIYKNIYKQRSKFLHTGFNMTPPPSYVAGLPLDVLEPGLELGHPDYYYNITDWTGYLLRNDIIREIKRK
ncbi:TPA: hypothetical protein ACNVU4_002135 [Morganella morganii]